MTSGNAFGFLLFSAVMIVAPTLNPGWFPANGFDGTSTRAIWLVLMGIVNGGIGASFLVSRWVVPAVLRIASFRPQTIRGGAMLPDGAAQGSVI